MRQRTGRRRIFLLSAMVLALVVGVGQAGAVTITFDDGVAGTPIGAFYAAQGAIFTNASFQNNSGVTGLSGLTLGDITDPVNPPFNPGPSSRIIGTFTSLQSSVSIIAGDVGADGAQLDVCSDAACNSILASDQLIGIGAGVGTFTTLSASAAGIQSFAVYQPLNVLGAGDGLLFDTLTFTAAVPEPTALILLLAGVGVGGALLHSVRRHGA
jgi:hypothetical protein